MPGVSHTTNLIQTGTVVANRCLCREHFRITFRLPTFCDAQPGQFVHLCPQRRSACGYQVLDGSCETDHAAWMNDWHGPMLRRAFSIAGMTLDNGGVEIDVIYRVVGTATRWMESLGAHDPLSVLGPLGNSFPIVDRKSTAWLVAGGVGLPPMLWLAEALHRAGKRTLAFCGARSADLLALSLDPSAPPAADARVAEPSANEFARWKALTLISTDDGSLGFHGHIGEAMASFHQSNPIAAADLVVYTCGPEPMMRFVSEYCRARSIECYVCMERNMACGTGMCQSCVVPVRDEGDPQGWVYRLCCMEGPIFAAERILWHPVGV